MKELTNTEESEEVGEEDEEEGEEEEEESVPQLVQGKWMWKWNWRLDFYQKMIKLLMYNVGLNIPWEYLMYEATIQNGFSS